MNTIGFEDAITGKAGEVWEVDEDGSRLLYAAGTPGAEAWLAENREPHDLEPLEEPQ